MKTQTVFLNTFKSILPVYSRPQKDLINWILAIHEKNKLLSGSQEKTLSPEVLERFCINERQIQQRYFECPDVYGDTTSRIYEITDKTPSGSSIYEKNKFFSRRCLEIFNELYAEGKEEAQHVLHVTCTGYVSPSAPQVFFSTRKNPISITHAYHMGCYASLPAVRMGRALVLAGEKRVDIVHNEMCSLHLDPGLHTPEQMVVQTLFADGHIKYEASSVPKSGWNLEIKIVKEEVLPDSAEDMTWIPSAHGMSMTLSREVPLKIKDSIVPFVKSMVEEAGYRIEDILQNAIFAIHPGGPKIIDSVQGKLEVRDAQVEFSRKILLERGNMSSATLPHVWKDILDSRPLDGSVVVSLAFGPGLTIFGAIYEVRKC